ncbi:ElyC/SanA/YdcF family protein [Marinovum sp.]|uniref:ElyC/SanA/YdcF family protein n=1 Tax=Marinovum sp. TaxID=2024839 RepID=UPI003A8E4B93
MLLAFLLFDFMTRSAPPQGNGALPPTAIVFTGDFDRIRTGLDLLASEEVERLFITGVNGDAGLNIPRFRNQFELSSYQTDWLATGQIILAPDAHTTLENAREAACWLETQPDVDAVTLITSRQHMARASVALQHGIGRVSVVRVISNPEEPYDRLNLDLNEFSQFVATWAITLLPDDLWPGNEPALCWGR